MDRVAQETLLVLLFAGACGAAMYLWIWRKLRRTSYLEWHQRWKSIDGPRRREIARSIRRGEAVRDPRDAELALDLIRTHRATTEALRPRSRNRVLAAIILAADVVLTIGACIAAILAFDPWSAPAIAAPVLLVTALWRTSRKHSDRLERAREANERLIAGLGYATESQPDAKDAPGSGASSALERT